MKGRRPRPHDNNAVVIHVTPLSETLQAGWAARVADLDAALKLALEEIRDLNRIIRTNSYVDAKTIITCLERLQQTLELPPNEMMMRLADCNVGLVYMVHRVCDLLDEARKRG